MHKGEGRMGNLRIVNDLLTGHGRVAVLGFAGGADAGIEPTPEGFTGG